MTLKKTSNFNYYEEAGTSYDYKECLFHVISKQINEHLPPMTSDKLQERVDVCVLCLCFVV